MKKHPLIIVLIVFGLISYNNLLAQDDDVALTKQEIKELKKQAKQYAKNPAELKQLIDDNESLTSEVSSLTSRTQSLQSQVGDKDAKISELQDDMAKLRRDLASAKSAAESAMKEEESSSQSADRVMKGVVFKVQIGAFRNKDLSKYFDNNENFSGETDGDGTQKITLGQFADYWEADTFKKYLREMGVKDAWIVPYKDGIRVPIKDVLEGVMSSSDS